MEGNIAASGRAMRRSRAVFCVAVALLLWCAIFAAAELLLPEPSGEIVYEQKGTTIDVSHGEQGYVMVKQSATASALKLRISLGQYTLTYDLNGDGEYEVFPLQLGSGKYKFQVFSQVKGKQYASVSSTTIRIDVENPLSPYLYPNQYVHYDAETLAIAEADRLCEGLTTDQEKLDAIHQYVVDNIVYDDERAAKVRAGQMTGYLPDLDDVFIHQKGICFDYSALMACMLRSQGVPAQLVIGYADRVYHAWNLVWVNNEWQLIDSTTEVAGGTVGRYTTERMY